MIKTVGTKKEIIAVHKETKKLISGIIVKSNIDPKSQGKLVRIQKQAVSNNIANFDFTLKLHD